MENEKLINFAFDVTDLIYSNLSRFYVLYQIKYNHSSMRLYIILFFILLIPIIYFTNI